MVKVLLDDPRVDVNIRSNCGLSALHEVLNRCPPAEARLYYETINKGVGRPFVDYHARVSEMLLRKGADPDCRDC